MKITMVILAFAAIAFSSNSFAYTGGEIENQSTQGAGTNKTSRLETKLSVAAEFQLLMAIHDAKSKYQFDSKKFIITKTDHSNASKFALEVEKFLIAKGTDVQAYGTKAMDLKGYIIIKNETCFEIIIGVM